MSSSASFSETEEELDILQLIRDTVDKEFRPHVAKEASEPVIHHKASLIYDYNMKLRAVMPVHWNFQSPKARYFKIKTPITTGKRWDNIYNVLVKDVFNKNQIDDHVVVFYDRRDKQSEAYMSGKARYKRRLVDMESPEARAGYLQKCKKRLSGADTDDDPKEGGILPPLENLEKHKKVLGEQAFGEVVEAVVFTVLFCLDLDEDAKHDFKQRNLSELIDSVMEKSTGTTESGFVDDAGHGPGEDTKISTFCTPHKD